MTFKALCEYFENIENTASRNEMSSIISQIYSKLSKDEAQIFSYLLVGRVAPLFVPAEFNFSEKGMLKVLDQMAGKKDVKELRKEYGDIGLVAQEIVKGTKGYSNLVSVYDDLWKIVNEKGSGSNERKYAQVFKMLSKCSPVEAKYLSRIIVGNIRIGVSVKSILDGLSMFLNGDKKYSELLERAYGCSTDLGYLAGEVVENKDNVEEFLNGIKVIPGIPVLAKLVQKVGSFEDGFERMEGKFVLQPKYDGLRCQIHKYTPGNINYKERLWFVREQKPVELGMFSVDGEVEVKLFTRNLEDMTAMFPEIVESAKALPYDDIVLDSEIVGWDSKDVKFLSYQDTMTRKRKFDVGNKSKEVPVNAFVFDILEKNGETLISLQMKERKDLVEKLDFSKSKSLQISPMSEISTIEEMKADFSKYVLENLEGIVIKKMDSIYTPGVRDFDWIKIKKSIDEKLVDTLDLVVLGYYKGSGKRTDFGIGAILAGIYNESEDRFESFTKVGTGITDAMFKTIFERLEPLVVKEKPKNVVVEDVLIPDVWVYPEVVITVTADEISKNRRESEVAKGYSLRFPRLVDWDRDKDPYEIFRVEDLS